MRIEHIALYTKNLEKMKDFYCTYFEAKSNEKYVNAKGFSSYFISFDDGARLEIMTAEDICGENAKRAYGYAHLAVSVGSKEEVDRITKKLQGDDFLIISEPRITGDGYYESVACDIDGNLLEITV